MSPPPCGRPSRPRSPCCPHPCHLLWLQKAGAVCPSTAAHAGLMGWLVRPESHAQALTPGPLNVTIWSQRLEGGKLEGFQGGGLTPPPGPRGTPHPCPARTTRALASARCHHPHCPPSRGSSSPRGGAWFQRLSQTPHFPKRQPGSPAPPCLPLPFPPLASLGRRWQVPREDPVSAGDRGALSVAVLESVQGCWAFRQNPRKAVGQAGSWQETKAASAVLFLKAFRDGPVTWVWALRKALLGPPRLQGRDRGQVIGEGGYGRSCHRG